MKEKRINVANALLHGDLLTRISAILMGVGIIGHGQYVKGALILLLEAAFILYFVNTGIGNLSLMGTLGTNPGGEVWNEKKQVYEYVAGDNSQQILLAGVITCFVIA